jgi:uridine kinase
LAPRNAVLLFDGIFLLRPELNDLWDFRVFLQVDFEETLRRATERDEKLFGSREAVRRRYLRRYVPAQRLYLDSVRPELIADVVVTPSPSGFKLNVSP